MPIGFSFPFALSTGSLGYLESSNSVDEAIRSNCRSLILTNKGERLMHPDFGCSIRDFCFEQKTDSLRSTIAERIKVQFERWLPFVKLVKLFIVFSSDDVSISENAIRVEVSARFGNVPINLSIDIED